MSTTRLTSPDWFSQEEKNVDNSNEYLGRFVLTTVSHLLPTGKYSAGSEAKQFAEVLQMKTAANGL